MKFILRKVRVSDAKKLARLIGAVAEEKKYLTTLTTPNPELVSELISKGNDRDDIRYVSEHNGELIGWVDITRKDGKSLSHIGLLSIGVKKGFRRKGIGTSMLSLVFNDSAVMSFSRIEIEAFLGNEAAIRLYRKYGFAVECIKIDACRIGNKAIDIVSMVRFIRMSNESKTSRMLQKPFVFIVDNFLLNPDELRGDVLKSEFADYSQGGFSCAIYRGETNEIKRLVPAIAKILNISPSRFLETQVLSYKTADERKNKRNNLWIHSDRCRWVAILMLFPDPPADGGISFYRHIETNCFRWEQVETASNNDGVGMAIKIKNDSANLKQWEELYRIDNKYNRLACFDSKIFHQATGYFGEELSESRLTVNFYFK